MGSGLRIIHANDDTSLIAFQRWWDHGVRDDTVVIANLDAQARDKYTIGMPAEGIVEAAVQQRLDDLLRRLRRLRLLRRDRLPRGYDGMPAHADIDIAPYSLLVYSQD